MPKPAKTWFESLKKQMQEKGYDLSNPACTLFLGDMDLNGGFNPQPGPALMSIPDRKSGDPEKYIKGAIPFDKLSDENIEALYALAEKGQLVLFPPDMTDYSKPELVKVHKVVAEAGKENISCTIEDPSGRKKEKEEQKKVIELEDLNEVERRNQEAKKASRNRKKRRKNRWRLKNKNNIPNLQNNEPKPEENQAQQANQNQPDNNPPQEQAQPQPEFNNPFISDSEDVQRERNWQLSIAREMYARPGYYVTPELAAERAKQHKFSANNEHAAAEEGEAVNSPIIAISPAAKTLNVEKTLTDLFDPGQNGKVNLEELLSAGLIRDDKGMLFEDGNRPWDKLDRFMAHVNSGRPILAVSLDGKRYVSVYPFENPPVELNNQPKKELIKPSVKKGALESLKDIRDRLEKFEGKTDRITVLKNLYDNAIEKLNDTPFQEDFVLGMRDFVQVAGAMYQDGIEKKTSNSKLRLDDIIKDIKQIDKCVRKNVDPREHKLSVEDKQRIDIATKSAYTFAKINSQVTGNEKLAEQAKAVLHNSFAMDKQVQEHMNSPEFIALYGKFGDKKKNALLSKAAKASGKDLAKIYNDKKTELAKENKNRAEQFDRSSQSRMSTMTKGHVSPDVREDLARMIADMKKDLDSLWHEDRTSEEFKQFRQSLEMTHLRLQRTNNPEMNVKRQMAELATYADKYYISHAGLDINRRGIKRFRQISRIRHMTDAIMENKRPSENMPSEEDMFREDIAAKMVYHAANELTKKGGEDNIFEADRLLHNPRVFNRELQKVMNSEQFKALYANADLETLKKDLKESDVVINIKLNNKKKEINKLKHPVENERKKEEEKELESMELGAGVA